MKNVLCAAASLSLAGFVSAAAFAGEDVPTCSLATLQGTYAFAGSGTDGGVPYTTSGRETYDGHGHIHYFQLWDEAGVTTPYEGTGTYTVDASCVAHATYGPHSQWTYFLAPDGGVFFYNNNNNTGVMSAGSETRLSYASLF